MTPRIHRILQSLTKERKLGTLGTAICETAEFLFFCLVFPLCVLIMVLVLFAVVSVQYKRVSDPAFNEKWEREVIHKKQ